MKKNKNQSGSGFTLLELLVVISIISFLASIIIVAENNARMKARDAVRAANLHQLASALDLYQQDNGSYPSTGGAWWGACDDYGDHGLTGATGWIPNLAPTYTAKLPIDPDNNRVNFRAGSHCSAFAGENCYLYRSDGTDYKLLANCTPETSFDPNSTFYDINRPTWAWQVSTPGGIYW